MMIPLISLVLIIIILTSLGQIFLKIGSQSGNNSLIKTLTHPLSLLGYLTFAIVAFLSIDAIKEIELKVFFALTSLTYVIVVFFSYIFLHEKITKNKILGVFLITFGVIIFNF
jgi:drug/metabolite transporter (DMT)-like permease